MYRLKLVKPVQARRVLGVQMTKRRLIAAYGTATAVFGILIGAVTYTKGKRDGGDEMLGGAAPEAAHVRPTLYDQEDPANV